MLDAQDARSIMGATAYGSDGDKIGRVGQVVTPVERVRPGTQASTDEDTVTTGVAKEHIEVDGDTARTGRSGTRSADDRG